MAWVTAEQRKRAFGRVHMRATHRHVARTFGCSRVVVGNLLQRFRQTWRTTDRLWTGRPRVTIRQEDRYFPSLHLRNRFLTVTSSAAHALDRWLSTSTVIKRLRAAGFRAYSQFTGQMTTQHRRRQPRFATNNADVLPWQPYSPHSSPIELLWDVLDRRVRERPHPPGNRQDLIHALQVESNRLSRAIIRRLTFDDFRPEACLEAHSGHTLY